MAAQTQSSAKAPFKRSTAFLWLTVVAGGVVLAALRQLDGALASRHPPGSTGLGVLEFPTLLSGERAETIRTAVESWYKAKPDERFADGAALAYRILALDVIFIVVYGTAAAIVIRRLSRGSAGPNPVARFGHALLALAVACLVALVVVDLVEDAFAALTVRAEWGRCADGRCSGSGASAWMVTALAGATTIKLLLIPFVVIPPLLACIRAPALHHQEVGQRVRIVVMALAAFAALLLLGIGGEQSAEVMRAWDLEHAAFAFAAVSALAVITWGGVRFMTTQVGIAGRSGGAVGRSPHKPLGWGGAALLLAGGGLSQVPGWSGAVAVAGALLLVVVVASLLLGDVPVRPGPEQPPARVALVRAEHERIGRLWARALAAAVLFVSAFTALRAAAFDMLARSPLFGSKDIWAYPTLFGALCVGGAMAFLLRRRQSPLAPHVAAVVGGSLAIVAAVVLFAAPLEVGGGIGAMAVIALFFAALIALVGAVTLVGAPIGDRYRMPSALAALGFRRFPTLLFVVSWFALASTLPPVDRGGYHDVRVKKVKPQGAVSFEQVWTRWRDRNVGSGKGDASKAVPLIMVGASGGGIRAAAWTSLALDCIFERLPGEDAGADSHCPAPEPGRWRRTRATTASDTLFALSGTSGGSLGLVEYDAYLRNKAEHTEDAGNWVEDRLGDDFVAPTVAGLLFRDLPRTFIGVDASDRASLLEQAWEEPWQGERARLDTGLRDSWSASSDDAERPLRPLLLLTGTSVEDGCRFMTSVLEANTQQRDTDDDCLRLSAYGPGAPAGATQLLPGATELTDFLCPEADVRMSTAALLSARFAFVSPSGRIEAKPCASVGGDAITYVVDGGYFDNSGAVAPVDLWRALAPKIAQQNASGGTCIVPVYVQLDNDFEAEPAPGRDPRPLELLVPPLVLFGGIGSHETAARAEAAATFDWPSSVLGDRRVFGGIANLRHLWVRLAPRAHPGPQSPLGWSLSAASFEDMAHELAADYNQPALDVLAGALSDNLSCN